MGVTPYSLVDRHTEEHLMEHAVYIWRAQYQLFKLFTEWSLSR